jgi:uncharacterized protein YndB with AHSA1/START domain
VTDDREPATAVVQRVLPAPPDAVYDEWLDAEGMGQVDVPAPGPAHQDRA